jgi:hypothetical protein
VIHEIRIKLFVLADAQEVLSESEMSIKVDLLDWLRIDDDFKKIILKKSLELCEKNR